MSKQLAIRLDKKRILSVKSILISNGFIPRRDGWDNETDWDEGVVRDSDGFDLYLTLYFFQSGYDICVHNHTCGFETINGNKWTDEDILNLSLLSRLWEDIYA